MKNKVCWDPRGATSYKRLRCLQSGSLQSRATNLGSQEPLIKLGVESLGASSLGAYNLGRAIYNLGRAGLGPSPRATGVHEIQRTRELRNANLDSCGRPEIGWARIAWDHLCLGSSEIVSSRVIWYHLGSSGIVCDHLGSSVDIWVGEHLESSGSSWDHLGTSGIILVWNNLGTSRLGSSGII